MTIIDKTYYIVRFIDFQDLVYEYVIQLYKFGLSNQTKQVQMNSRRSFIYQSSLGAFALVANP